MFWLNKAEQTTIRSTPFIYASRIKTFLLNDCVTGVNTQ